MSFIGGITIKDYGPENVQWMTKKEHAMHHSNGRWIVVDEIRDSVDGTSRRIGISDQAFNRWLNRGLEPQEGVEQQRSGLSCL
jgi:hypothetical protein